MKELEHYSKEYIFRKYLIFCVFLEIDFLLGTRLFSQMAN